MANVDKNLVTTNDLDNKSFESVTVGQERSIELRLSPDADNTLRLTDNGLKNIPATLQDTGWRRLNTSKLRKGYIAIRRVGNVVYLGLKGGDWDTVEVIPWEARHILGYMPDGFRGEVATLSPATKDGSQQIGFFVYTGSGDANIIEIKGYNRQSTPRDLIRVGMISFPCTQPFPTNISYPLV